MDGLDGDEVEASLVSVERNFKEAEEAVGLVGGRSGNSGSNRLAISNEDATQVFKKEEIVRGLGFVLFSILSQHEDSDSGGLCSRQDGRLALAANGEVDSVDQDFAFGIGACHSAGRSEDLDEDGGGVCWRNNVGDRDFAPASVSSREVFEPNIRAVDGLVSSVKPLEAVLLDVADS